REHLVAHRDRIWATPDTRRRCRFQLLRPCRHTTPSCPYHPCDSLHADQICRLHAGRRTGCATRNATMTVVQTDPPKEGTAAISGAETDLRSRNAVDIDRLRLPIGEYECVRAPWPCAAIGLVEQSQENVGAGELTPIG